MTNKKLLRLAVVFWSIWCILVAFGPPSYASDQKNDNILVLNSYHKGFPWTDNIVRGIESVLVPDSTNNKLVVEYMDTKSMGFDKDYKQKLYELLKFKYKDQHFDLIISSDDNAFDLLREFGEELFPGVPIVVCGVNNRKAPDIVDPARITGVLESTSNIETIELILNLHPETKKIYLIIDKTPSGKHRWRVTEPSFSLFEGIEFIRISDDYSIIEIEETVSKLDEDSAVIFFTLYRDSSGKYLTVKESASRVTNASARPVYTTHLLELPYGVVGGKVLGGFHHGETVAKIGMRILNGEKVENIPFLLNSPTQYVFDHDQLEKWNIQQSSLPDESIILNQPFSVYEAYKGYIWIVIIVIIILIAVIFALQINNFKRKQAEKELLKSEKKYRNLFDNIYDVYYQSNEKGIITLISPSVEKIFGYAPDELIGRELKDFYVYPDEREKLLSLLYRDGYAENFVALLRRKDNADIWVSTNVKLIKDPEGIVLGLEGIARDITRQKKLEERIRQTQKMESIGNLAGGIAHDFNNILSAIIGFTELALEEAEKDSKQEDDIKEVIAAGNRAKDLVGQILAFARQSEEKLKPVRLCDVIENTLKILRPSTPTSIQIVSNIDSNSHVQANLSQLEQVMLNLCTNSVHALQNEGDTLEIDLRDIVLPKSVASGSLASEKDQYIQLAVSDNGPGIEPEIIERVFEPYYTTKEVGEGTGMGLAMVKGIIENWGGQINVISEPHAKTTFTVILPITTNINTVNPSQAEAYVLGTEHILFVDDELPIAKMGSRILEGLGYKVTVRTSSIEALELFREKKAEFDLIITDMTMPSMTGDELAIEVQKIKKGIPIIICTGYSNKMNEGKAKLIGVSAFAYKPFTMANFSKTVREVLDENNSKEQQNEKSNPAI